MDPFTVVMNVVTVAVAVGLACPTGSGAYNMMNRYGKQQLVQKYNRYGKPPAWMNSIRSASWMSQYGDGDMMRHYPISSSVSRYLQGATGGNKQILSDDYYDPDVVNAYNPRSYDHRLQDYAVVRYPSYGYYPATAVADLTGYDAEYDNNVPFYDEPSSYVDRELFPSPSLGMGNGVGGVSSFYPTKTLNRYLQTPSVPLQSSLNRYPAVATTGTVPEPITRYPTDKIHTFRKVFLSNPVSPSNKFKSPKEQQLYNFWESLVSGDLDDRDVDGEQQRDRQQQQVVPDSISRLYHHLPPIFQKLQKQQKLRDQHPLSQRTLLLPSESSSSLSAASPSESSIPLLPLFSLQSSPSSPMLSSSSSSSSSYSSSSLSKSAPHGNHFLQWAAGSPLIKRSYNNYVQPSPSSENDDVQQLERLKTESNTTATANSTVSTTTTVVAVTTTTTSAPVPAPMADGGQREYVLPRPAGEKSGFESLLEAIAEGGLRGHIDEKSTAAYNKVST